MAGSDVSDRRTHYRRLGYVACLLIVVLALVLWQVVNRSTEPAEHMPDDVPASGPSEAAADAPLSDDAGAAQLPPDALWRPVDESTVDPQSVPAYKEVVEGRVLVQLADTQRRLAVGDRVSVSIPQLGETYRPVVERIETGPGTTRSFVGSSAATDDQRHRLVFTQGPRSTFAHIGTPQGTYELVANGELGWLMPTANMDQHVDYSKPDYYIVRPGGPDRPQDARR